MKRLLVGLLIALPLAVSGAQAASSPALPAILDAGYPRAFFFRRTEGEAAAGKLTFEQWEKRFLPLGGIMGKVLEEEVPGRSRGQDYFVRYKKAHPEKAVLLHYNGNARDPRDNHGRFFDGHWIYHNGCKVTKDLPARGGESVVHVEDPSLFHVNMGRYTDKNEDLAICRLGPGGKPDWGRAEQVELISIDSAKKTLRIRRGAFDTKPLAFPKGQSYIAAHATEGPWGKRSNLMWFYNYSTACPKDSAGRTCADMLLEDLAGLFGPGGALEVFDGLEFDVMGFSKLPRNGKLGSRALDVDADGRPDGGAIDGINVYGIGVYEFHRRLREAFGENRLIMADAQGERNQRSVGLLNGIESEGFPILGDPDIVDWSGAVNRHFFWRDNARPPAFNYINHKFKKDNKTFMPAMNINRLVLAAGMLVDCAITYSLQPPRSEGVAVGIWDELRMGVEDKKNWLGAPLGEPIRLGLRSPDLLEGAGREATEDFLRNWKSENAAVSRAIDGGGFVISGCEGAKGEPRLSYVGLQAPEGDLLVSCIISAAPRAGYPPEIPRAIYLGCEGAGQLVRATPPESGQTRRGENETGLDGASGASVKYSGVIFIAGEQHEAYRIHPPYKGGRAGSVYWETNVSIPRGAARLDFHTGLTPAPGKSDGIVYSVYLTAGGKSVRLFEEWHKVFAWTKHSVDLGAWAGREATLRFVADAGPDDNATADHGYWGDAYLGSGKPAFRRSPYSPGRIMTLANEKPFHATFFFRDAGPADLNLSLEIEGAEPVHVSDFTIHSAPDAMARAFEHGVVLANPSMRETRFDLRELFPSFRLRRLQGSLEQDPKTNTGGPVGDSVVLGPRDGLFLVKE
jgi:hypothetical protein